SFSNKCNEDTETTIILLSRASISPMSGRPVAKKQIWSCSTCRRLYRSRSFNLKQKSHKRTNPVPVNRKLRREHSLRPRSSHLFRPAWKSQRFHKKRTMRPLPKKHRPQVCPTNHSKKKRNRVAAPLKRLPPPRATTERL